MTQTYSQVTRQIAALQSKAEQLKKREIEGVVERIRAAIKAYGLTSEHLFGAASVTSRAPAKGGKRVAKQQYADGQGNVWGGMGPRPQWLRTALADGRRLEEFAQSGSGTSASEGTPTDAGRKTRRAAKRGKKRPVRQGYSNGTESWSGFGRQPKWLQEALAGGARLDDLKAAAKQ